MPFRGLTMLKSPKLIIKGGLCYGFAMVTIFWQTLGTPIQSVSWLYNQSSVGIQLNFGSHEYEFGQRSVKVEFEKEILGLDRRPPHLPPTTYIDSYTRYKHIDT